MCRQLDALRQSIAEFAAGFDARTMLPSEAGSVLRVCAQMEASITSVKALASARLAEGSAWQGEGYRSPAGHLAHVVGMSPSNAKRLLETGRRMADQPEVAAAALAGELSPEQMAAVAEGAAANPAKAGELIDKAKSSTLPELNEEVARAKAEVTDQEARRREIHKKRSFRRWTDRDGAFHAHLYGNPEDGVAIWRMLDPIRRRLIVLRRGGDAGRESLDALDYDALMMLASAAAGSTGELSMPDLVELGLFPETAAADRGAGPVIVADPGAGPVAVVGPSRRLDAVGPLPTTPPAPDPSAPGPAPVSPPGPAAASPPAPPSGSPPAGSPPSGSPPSGSPPAPPPASDADPCRPPDPPPTRKKTKKLGFSPAKVIIRADLDTLLRGITGEGELCEIVGYGPVAVSVVQELIERGQAAVAMVLTRAQEIQGVYHFGRRPNAVQTTALDFLYPLCAVLGCNARAGLQSDHRKDWIKTKFTLFDLLDRLCPHHHRLKTHKGWALVEGTGRRDFVPPSDPRHPRFQSAGGGRLADPAHHRAG